MVRWMRMPVVGSLWCCVAALTCSAAVGRGEIDERIERGERFLTNLFDAHMELLPEFEGSRTYWLFHDNYLAAKLLERSRPDLSGRIWSALRRYGVTNSGKIEIVFGEAKEALPFRNYLLTNVAMVDGKRIRTEVVTTNVFGGWREYADLLLLGAMAEAKSEPASARGDFDQAASMWDGTGFKDQATKKSGLYATYKLGLFLITAERLNVASPLRDQVMARLLAMQATSGGWITDYKAEKAVGLANVETTSLALLALRALEDTPSPGARVASRITLPLKAHSQNPNYFADESGRAVYLTGSHTWNNVQDWGTDDAPQTFDFEAYVKMLLEHGHNFTLLWQTELPVFRGLPTKEKDSPDFYVTPQPWLEIGPGMASDGKLRFDLTQFNEGYFVRLRKRVNRLQHAGIYAGVYLFSGEWLLRFRFVGDGYPLTDGNNVNGIGDGGGVKSVTMTGTNAITAVQDAFVRKMIDTLNDLPNVLWIVSQEAPPGSEWWNDHLIKVTRAYEGTKRWQHPIGYGVMADSKDATLLNSDADWIAPAAKISPTRSCGTGHPECKVNINDSDHSYFGMWNDTPQVNRNYFWINFTQGNQTLFMDPYVVFYPREKRNMSPAPVHGISPKPDERWENVRATMGWIRSYADRINLAAMVPRAELSSTGHALASANTGSAEILVYAPEGGRFTVNLGGTLGPFTVEWMNAAKGERIAAEPVSGGESAAFTAPFEGDAVLYLKRK
jgi:hypothetical protein